MKNRAFTLIELLAAVTVLAVVAFIGVYSVTSIINKSKISSLNNTALIVKKAAKLHQSKNYKDDLISIDLTPGSNLANDLLTLDVDPWGDDYVSIVAYYDLENKKPKITIVIITLNHGKWILNPDAEKIEELSFKIVGVHSTKDKVNTEEMIDIKFDIPPLYNAHVINGLEFRVTKNGINTDNYTLGTHNFARDENGYYTAQLAINEAGLYNIYLKPKDESDIGEEGGPLSIEVIGEPLPPEPSLSPLTVVVDASTYTGDQYTGSSTETQRVDFKVNNPSGLTPLTMTIKIKKADGSFVDAVTNMTVNTATTYSIKRTNIVGNIVADWSYKHEEGDYYRSATEWETYARRFIYI